MALLVALLGISISLFGLAGLCAPQRVVDGMLGWKPRTRYRFAVGIRLAFGIVLLVGASSCRFATVVFALGALATVTALVLACGGPARVDSMFRWWLHRPGSLLRTWFAAAVPFGAFLAYAPL